MGGTMASPGQIMRDLINAPEILIMPGVYDGFSVRLVESMGFKAAGISGAGLSETNLGWADLGIMGYEENLRSSAALAACCAIPLQADGDTGYGNAVNVHFTVQGFERAGLAGLMLEDQVWPKRCGHLAGKEVISAEDIALVARNVSKPLSVNMGFGIRQRPTTPLIPARQLEDMGVAAVSYPRILTAAAIQGMKNALGALGDQLKTGEIVDRTDLLVSFKELNELMGINQLKQIEQRFLTAAQLKTKYGA